MPRYLSILILIEIVPCLTLSDISRDYTNFPSHSYWFIIIPCCLRSYQKFVNYRISSSSRFQCVFAFEILVSTCIGRTTWENVDFNDFKIFNLARFLLLMNRSGIYIYDINKIFGNFTEKKLISLHDHKLHLIQLRIRPIYPIQELRSPIILGWRIDYDMITYRNDYQIYQNI